MMITPAFTAAVTATRVSVATARTAFPETGAARCNAAG